MHSQSTTSAIKSIMRPIWNEPIVHASAWAGAGIGGKGGLVRRLGEPHLAALEVVLQKTQSLLPQAVEREQFDHPLLNRFLADIRRDIIHGRGVVVIQGLTLDRFTLDELERIYWGFGTHWGIAAAQSVDGDRIGRVRIDPNNPKDSGYQSARELAFHNDAYELLGLMCIENADHGGCTRLVSALSIYNEILRSRPDLLPALYQGFPYATEATDTTITAISIPVFSCVEGKISCMYLPRYMRKAAALMNTSIPSDLEEALQFFEQTSMRDDLVVEFSLEPGEMLICHNYTNLHARTEFTDGGVKRRYLLRLWLSVPDGRPFDPALLERSAIYDRLLQKSPVGR